LGREMPCLHATRYAAIRAAVRDAAKILTAAAMNRLATIVGTA